MNLLSHRFLLILLGALCLAIGRAHAAPADEITAAVLASGASSVESATPVQFTRAYSSVLTRVPERKHCEYLTAAIRLRPDLAGRSTAATLRAHRPGVDDDCDWVNPIIRCALAAAPNAREAIVRASIEQLPEARECILAAAGMEDGQLVSFRPPGVDAGNINSTALGTINPGNFSGQGNVVSPGQERVTICHNGQTLTLPRPAADAHLRNHPNDTIGPCP